MTPNVLILQENPRINYSPATKFGKLKFVTNKEYTGNPSSITDAQIINELRSAINEYDLERDYVLLSGSPILIGIAMVLLAQKIKNDPDIGVLCVLHYDRNKNMYNEVEIDMSQLTEYEIGD